MSNYLQQLFEKLKDKHVDYILLDVDENGDTDLVVSPDNKRSFLETLQQFGWLERREPSHYLNRFWYAKLLPEEGRILWLDVEYKAGVADAEQENIERKKRHQATKPTPGIGYCVFFIGTDGAGKTTAVQAVEDILPVLKISRLYLGEKQWAIPLIGRLYQSKNRFLKILSLRLFYPIDLWLRVRQKRKDGRHRLFLVDRIPGFPFVWEERTSELEFMYLKTLPYPDLIVFLTADPSVLQERKKGESTVRTLLQIEADAEKWREVYGVLSFRYLQVKCLRVDTTSLNKDEVALVVVQKILNDPRFSERIFKKVELNQWEEFKQSLEKERNG